LHRLYGLDRGDVRYHAAPAAMVSVSGQAEIDAANMLVTATGAHPAVEVVLTNRAPRSSCR